MSKKTAAPRNGALSSRRMSDGAAFANPQSTDDADCRTFFLAPETWESGVLEGQEAHHLIKVLRIGTGEIIHALDGQGREGTFRVLELNRHTVRLEALIQQQHSVPPSRVILAAGWTKAARRGWIFEKAVEFEASAIWFWQAEYSQFPVPAEAKEGWQGQLVAGAKQCRNPWLPAVRTFPDGVQGLVAAADALNCAHRHLLVEEPHGPALPLTPDHLAQPGDTLCVIGPEGGFSTKEVTVLKNQGFTPFTLGSRILRWETAAVLCLGLHWWQRQLPKA